MPIASAAHRHHSKKAEKSKRGPSVNTNASFVEECEGETGEHNNSEEYNDATDHLFTFPPAEYRKGDIELGVLMSGWDFFHNQLQVDFLEHMHDPDSASIVSDHACLGRNWKTRRVVYSERVLSLAHVGAEKMLDVIPLSEIINIQDCDGVGSADADEGAGRVMLEITLTVGFWYV
jgi:hypothetical protein